MRSLGSLLALAVAVAGCDAIFTLNDPEPASPDGPPPASAPMIMSFDTAQPVDGNSNIAVTFAAGGVPGFALHYRITTNAGVIEQPTGQLEPGDRPGEHAKTVQWTTPENPVLAQLTLEVSYDPMLANPATEDYSVEVVRRFGTFTPTGNGSLLDPDTLHGYPVTIEVPGKVGISFVAMTGNSNARVALYQDSSGNPGSMVAGTDGQTVVTIGNVEVQTSGMVSPGSYWIGLLFDAAVELDGPPTGGDARETARAFSSGMPATFGAAAAADFDHTVYVVLHP
jgi:hypothetical protein